MEDRRALAGNTATGVLKLIALALMFVDHAGKMLFPGVLEMRMLGRIAFPLYCWCLVVGFHYTRSVPKYLFRIGLTGLISQPLYMLALNHTWREPNVFLTLFLGLCALWGIREKRWCSHLWAPAAALALAQAGCRVTVCARTPEKAAALAARCGGVTVSWEDLPRAAAEHGLLLNATPLGMEGSPEFESLDFVQALPAKAVVYDLVYHPTDTALMRVAEHRGLTAVGGLALLVQQAALSFAHFTGIVPDAALCRDILQELEAAQ